MKVIFKVIKAGSGNDVYFERLSEALKKAHIDSEIEYYSKYFQYVPWLLTVFNKKSDADIIHSNVEYGWAFKEKNKPLYVTLHHNVFDKEFRKFASFPQKIYHDNILKPNTKKSLDAATKRIAVSNYTKESFIKTFGNYNINVIYNFIDTDKYKPKEINTNDNRFKLLFVGNLIKRKGADLLPQIMSQLNPKDYVLYYTSGLRTKIPKEFNLPNMIPLGKLSEEELIGEYNKCDALLFPTRLEGFGYAVAEAMACGKPVISTNSSSIPEIIEDKINGYLYNVNDVNNFVEEIKSLKTKTRSEIKIINRKKIITKFSKLIIIKDYAKIY